MGASLDERTKNPMLKLYDCVVHQHDLRLAVFAALLCVFGAYATFTLAVLASTSDRKVMRVRWALAMIFVAATSIWATHLVAMAAFRIPMPSGYHLVPLVLSFFAALAPVGVAVYAEHRLRGRLLLAVASASLGFAIPASHFAAMAGLQVAGDVSWDPVAVVASVLVAIGFSVAALYAFGGRQRPRVALPAILFALGICIEHSIAMSAVTLTIDTGADFTDDLIAGPALALPVATVAMVVIGAAVAAFTWHRYIRAREAGEYQRLEGYADFAVEGLLVCDGSTVVWANSSAEALLERSRELLVGRLLSELLPAEAVTKLSSAPQVNAMIPVKRESLPVRLITKEIEFQGRPHTIIALRDQRDRLRVEAKMRRLADTDSLTGLVNRGRFTRTLERWLGSRRGDDRAVALFSLDLDRFKPVNDTQGHAAGDAVLVRVAGRLCSIVREGTVVARIGGDEFSIIARGMPNREAVRTLADRFVEVLSRPIAINGQIYEIGASVGVALAPWDGDTGEALVRNADLALYQAKRSGGGTHRMFEPGMDDQMQERRGLEVSLRRAAARQEFRVYFQPQVDARTGAYTGAEALIRWNHPERGIVPPSEFIAVAEQTNLIAGIGEWVLHTACAEAVTWPEHLTVAVNVSPVQFRDPRLVAIVAAALEESALPGHRLELEITEGVLIEDEDKALAILHELRRLGVRISLDDFGTGYLSLRHLSRFPFDKIKIDRSFVARASVDRDSAAIVRAIVSLGKNLGIATTAEGVETAEQRDFVTREGCDQLQGYLYGRPVPMADMPNAFRPTLNRKWLSSDSSIEAIAN